MRRVVGVLARPARVPASDRQPARAADRWNLPCARALPSLEAAPCTLLRPPSAPGCSSHSVRTASSLHPTHKAGRGIDPRQRRSARQLGSDSQTATPPPARQSVSPTALLAISCGATGALYKHAPQRRGSPTRLCLLPCACSPVLCESIVETTSLTTGQPPQGAARAASAARELCDAAVCAAAALG